MDGQGERAPAGRAGQLLAGLYWLAVSLGWRWDEERQKWAKPQGEQDEPGRATSG